MDSLGITIDFYRGCSAGACASAIHGSGVSGETMEMILRDTPAKKIFRPCLYDQFLWLLGADIRHLFDASGLYDLLEKHMKPVARDKVRVALSILPEFTPMLAKATPTTVYGSAAIPEVIAPVKIGKYLCCDGGVKNLIPTPDAIQADDYEHIYILLSPKDVPDGKTRGRIMRGIAAIMATMDREEEEVKQSWGSRKNVTILQPPPFPSGLLDWSKDYSLIKHARAYAQERLERAK